MQLMRFKRMQTVHVRVCVCVCVYLCVYCCVRLPSVKVFKSSPHGKATLKQRIAAIRERLRL